MKIAKKLSIVNSASIILQNFFSTNPVITKTVVEALILEVEQATKGTVLEITEFEFRDAVYQILNEVYFESFFHCSAWEMRDGGRFIDHVRDDIRRIFLDVSENEQAIRICHNLKEIMEDKGFLDPIHRKWTKFRYYEPSNLPSPSLETCPA